LLQLAPVPQLFPAGPVHVIVAAPEREEAVPSAHSTTAVPIRRLAAQRRPIFPISILRM
jgi:hypothetical protein